MQGRGNLWPHAKVEFGCDWKAVPNGATPINALSVTRDGTVLCWPRRSCSSPRAVIGDRQMHREDYLRIFAVLPLCAAWRRMFRRHRPGCPHRRAEVLTRHVTRMELLKLLVAPRDSTLAVMAHASCCCLCGGVPIFVRERQKVEAAMGDRCGARLSARRRYCRRCRRLWQWLRLTNNEHERLASMAEGWRRISPAFGDNAARRCSTASMQHFTDHALLGWARSRPTPDTKWHDSRRFRSVEGTGISC